MAGGGARISVCTPPLAAVETAAPLLAGFSAGVIATLAVLAAPSWVIPAVVVLVLVVWRFRGGAWIVCAAGLGSTLCLASVTSGLDARPAPEVRRDRVVSGTVVAQPKRVGDALRLDLETRAGRLRLSWYRDWPPVQIGSRWRLCVRLRAPRALINPGGYDASASALAERVVAVGYVRDCAANALLEDPVGIAAIRGQLTRALGRWPRGDMLRALVVGDDSALSRSTRGWLRATGTSHLFVISGLHVGMVAACALALARLVFRPIFSPSLARLLVAAVGLLAAGGYVLLAGAGLPAQRALIMTAVGVAAHAFGRRVLALESWLLAMSIVLLLDPLAPLGIGFWLSFGIVAALVVSARAAESGWRIPLRSQWVAFLGVFPMLAAMNSGVPVLAPLLNAVAIPVVGLLVVPMALAGALAWLAGIAMVSDVLWSGADSLLAMVGAGLQRAAAVGAVVHLPVHSQWLTVVAVLVALSWLLPVSRERRLWSLALFAVAMLPGPPELPQGRFRIWVLDVGQGLAVLVQTRAHSLLYDTGPGSPEGSVLASEVLPTLARLGAHLDRVIVSHGDADHAGGYLDPQAAARLRGVPILAGEPWRLSGTAATRCRQGQTWRWDGVRFTILHGGSGAASNDRSCVLLVTDGRHHALLPGDIGVGAELLVAHRLVLRGVWLDLLIAPHHGSSTSSSSALIARLRDADVVFSAAYQSRFGHPHPSVVARYRRAGARLWNTADSGALLWRDGEVRRRVRCQARLWRAPCARLGLATPRRSGVQRGDHPP